MAPGKHVFDQVMTDLQEWMTATREHLVSGLYQGDRAPFAADVSTKENIAYHEDLLFPGGQRDEAAIGRFIEARGEPAYARLLLEIDRSRRRETDTAPPPTGPAAPPAPGGYA